MPRRKPLDRLLTEGRDTRNPSRFRGRRGPVRTRPLGEPYATMDAVQQRHWRELADSLPWLRAHHRMLLHLTCHLAARLERGELGLTGMRTLTGLLSKLGATPTDEAKVAQRDDGGDLSPDEAFFRGRTQ